MTRKSIISLIRETMKQNYPSAQTILYGSEARNEAKEDSDIDLLILVEGNSLSIKEEEQIITPLYDIELETGITISPRVMLKKDWHNRPFDTPFYLNVTREGITL